MSKIDEQTLIEHLSEFRKRLIVTIVFFIIAFLISLVFCSSIYKLLTASFNQKLVVLGPNDILSIYLMLAGICAFSLNSSICKLSDMGICPSCIGRKRSQSRFILCSCNLYTVYCRSMFWFFFHNACIIKCASFIWR